jgi:hypothetical protein
MAVIYGDDKPCGRCGKTPPLEAGKETLTMIRTVFKAVKKELDAQKGKIRELSEIRANELERRRRSEKLTKLARGGLTATEKLELEGLQVEITALNARATALEGFFTANALLRWDARNKTYSRGYMVGVLVCVCLGKKLAACSGKAPPAFTRSVVAAGFQCASPPVGSPSAGDDEGWACAAKQIMQRVQGHKPRELIERWFSPMVKGLKASSGPQITFSVLIEDPSTKALTVETRTQRFKTGQNVPSCNKCQVGLPAIYCDTQC